MQITTKVGKQTEEMAPWVKCLLDKGAGETELPQIHVKWTGKHVQKSHL